MTNRDNQLEELLQQWKERTSKSDSRFNEDGIVNPVIWDSITATKVLFILKETNDLDGSLVKWLLEKESPAHYGSLWHRITEWLDAIHNPEKPYHYAPCNTQASLNQIAVINLKKTPGLGEAETTNLLQHTIDNWDLIALQIALIDPDVIVFCGTWGFVIQAFPQWKNLIPPEKHYQWSAHFYDTNNPCKQKLLIDFCHPVARYPAHLMYYGIQGIYRAALAENKK